MAPLPASDKPHQLCYRNNRQGERKQAQDILLRCLVPALLQLPPRGWLVEPSASSSYGRQQGFGSLKGSLPESQKTIQGEKKWLCPFAPGIRMSGRGGRGGRELQLCIVLRCLHCWHTPISFCCADPFQLPGLSTFDYRKGCLLSHVAPWQSPPYHSN